MLRIKNEMEERMNIRQGVKQIMRKSYEEESGPKEGDILDCALGRNSFGTSPRVVEFARQYDFCNLWDVADTGYIDLKQEICKFWSDNASLGVENIKVANGSAVVLSRFNKLFIEQGVKVLGYLPQFKEYILEVDILGGYYEADPLDPLENFKFNPDRFISKMESDQSIVYIDNPNNPTGQFINLSDIEKIVKEAAEKDIVVLIDEAYGDYVEEKNSAINLVNQYKNLVVTRSFTKGYGIGHFKVGYAILSTELGNYYDRIDLPFSVSTMGSELAVEGLRDRDFIPNLKKQVKAEKKRLIKGLSERGYLIVETFESCPIFIVAHGDKDINLKEEFLSKGILTTSGNDYVNMGKNFIRINTPPRADDFLARLEMKY